MRKMQEYIVKNNSIFVGLEDSKKTWKVCVRSERMIVHETSMPTEYENLRNYLKNRYPGCKVRVMYEAGFQGFWLHDRLEADDIDCIVTPPNKVTQEKSNKVKTDKIDARRLAKNLENMDYVSCHVPDKERREDRQISRTLDQVQKMITATKGRIRMFIYQHGLHENLPLGEWKPSDYTKLKELKLSYALQVSLDVHLKLLDELVNHRDHLLKELKALSKKERYQELVHYKKSCPGVGWLSAIRFTLEWGDLSRFRTGKHIASYAGLTSREYSTGDTVKRGRITGQSYERVRAWLIQCAWRAISSDPVLLHKYQSVWRNSGSKKKAIVAVARKLVVRMRALEWTQQPYCSGVIE